MKMRQRPEPTTEDNRETMAEVDRQLVKMTSTRDEWKLNIEHERLLDFICEVLESKDAAAKVCAQSQPGIVDGRCPSVVKVMTNCNKHIVAHGRCAEHQPTEDESVDRKWCSKVMIDGTRCVQPVFAGSRLCYAHSQPVGI